MGIALIGFINGFIFRLIPLIIYDIILIKYINNLNATDLGIKYALVIISIVFIVNIVLSVKIYENYKNKKETKNIIINTFIFWLVGLIISELTISNDNIKDTH